MRAQPMDFWKGIGQGYLRLIRLPLNTLAFFLPTERQAGRAENLGALLSLSFFLLSWLPGQQREQWDLTAGLENQEAGVRGKYHAHSSCQQRTPKAGWHPLDDPKRSGP